jgi:glycine betaine transporter
MTLILSIAVMVTLLLAIFIAIYWRDIECVGEIPVPFFTFIAILFTSGLDVGLVMFPLVDFELYASEESYAFANPLAMEFGFWGFLVWGFYFSTTFYFCVLEPRLKIFELPLVKWVNDVVIIGTCAFTGFLFLQYLPDYIEGISNTLRYGLVAAVILLAGISSTHIRFVRVLSVSSTWLFFGLIAGVWWSSEMGVTGLLGSMGNLGDYFTNLHRFVSPVTDYHQFYLYWWFAWSIMIGQFVSRFVSGLKAWQLLIALLVVPSIPIAIWFSVLYYHFSTELLIGAGWRWAMVLVGTVFVINSLDSLIRLYTRNVGLTAERFGNFWYVVSNWCVLFSLVLLYQFTPLQIEWFGLVVIGIYVAVFVLIIRRRESLSTGT